MKAFIKAMPAVMLAIVVMGCSSQKQMKNANVSLVNHQLALKALEDRMFIIESDHLIFAKKSEVKFAPGNYIYMQGNRAVMHLNESAFTTIRFDSSNVVDNNAELNFERRERNGNVHYTLIIRGERPYRNKRISITVLNNTNVADVKFYGATYHGLIFSFKGEIHPYDSESEE